MFVLIRPVVDAEAEKIRILAAAHLQRSRGSQENLPLSPESETRYRFFKASLIKHSGKCCRLFSQRVKFSNESEHEHSNGGL